MPFKARVVEGALKNKFAFVANQTDHRVYELSLEGLPEVRTMLSHNRQEVNRHLEGLMASQLGVPVSYFRGMITCSHSREAYYQHLRDNPHSAWRGPL